MLKILDNYKMFLDGTNKKDSTKASYLLDVGRLLKRFDERSISDITADDIQAYCDELIETHKESTVARMISSARAFWTYLIEQDICNVNPLENVRPKPKAPPPEPVVPEAPKPVPRAVVTGRDTINYLRDKCIMSLLSRTLVKLTDLVDMNVNSVDIENRQINLGEKRVIKMDNATAEQLSEYITFLENVFIPLDSPLFMNRDGGRLSRQGVWKVAKQMRKPFADMTDNG